MPGWGLTVATATLVGQALGAGQEDMAELSIRRTLTFASGLMGTMAVCFALFGRQFVIIFGASPEVLNLAGMAVRIAALEQVSIAAQMVLAGALRGAGDTHTPMYVTFFGVLFFRVAVVYLFAIVLGWGLAGVWLGTAVDWTGRASLMMVLFRRGRWKRVQV